MRVRTFEEKGSQVASRLGRHAKTMADCSSRVHGSGEHAVEEGGVNLLHAAGGCLQAESLVNQPGSAAG